jgi:hypothetical protein
MQDMLVCNLYYSLAGPEYVIAEMGMMVAIKLIQSLLTSIQHFEGTWARSIRYKAPSAASRMLLNLE